jgi:hypothetical protein
MAENQTPIGIKFKKQPVWVVFLSSGVELIEERFVEAAASVFMAASRMRKRGYIFFGVGTLGGMAGWAGVIADADANIAYARVGAHIL